MKTANLLIVILLLAAILATACGGAVPPTTAASKSVATNAAPAKAAWEQKWAAAVAQAKQEGGVTVYTTWGGDPIRKVLAAFSDKYGIKGDVVSARGPEIVQRMQSEKNAGITQVDIAMAGGTNLTFLMKPEGLLDNIEDVMLLPEVLDPKAWNTGEIPWYDKEHSSLAMLAVYNRYCLVNTDLVKPGEIASYKDLLDPKWKGQIAMNDPTITGAGNSYLAGLAAGVWGMDRTLDFIRGLAKQEIVITRDNRQLVEWVSKGKYKVALAATPELVSDFLKLGAPIKLNKVAEGGKIGAMTGGLGIAAKRPHPNATIVFVNWLLSDEGQAVFVKAVGLPGARVNAPREGIPDIFFRDPEEKFYRENEDTFRLEGEMLGKAKDILAPLLK